MSKPECSPDCPCVMDMDMEGCCQKDPTTPRCESCGVPYVKHLGLYGTCAEKTRYLSLLRRVIRMSCLTVERCPAGYPDVAEFLREEENMA